MKSRNGSWTCGDGGRWGWVGDREERGERSEKNNEEKENK